MPRASQLVRLAPTEFNLLRYLMVHAGKLVRKAPDPGARVDCDFGGEGRIVEYYLSYARRKIDKGTCR